MTHIVIIGAGFTDLEAAKKLSHWNVSITIVHGGEFAILQVASKSGVARRLRNSAQVKPLLQNSFVPHNPFAIL
jgi:NADH dehydrogenase FAD-containing subunit